MYEIIPVDQCIRGKVADFISINWGSTIIVSRGKRHSAQELSGFAVIIDGDIKGLITYNIDKYECEIVSLDSLVENQGIGTSLVEKVIEAARACACERVWLITTNDNTQAIRFYQKRGFSMAGLYLNAVNEARKIKPQIPLIGFDGIPILHELEFEKIID